MLSSIIVYLVSGTLLMWAYTWFMTKFDILQSEKSFGKLIGVGAVLFLFNPILTPLVFGILIGILIILGTIKLITALDK